MRHYRKILLSKICTRCQLETDKIYLCDHTNGKEMCTECYQEIHWLINMNKNAISD